MQVVKRDGTVEDFNFQKIYDAVAGAFKDLGRSVPEDVAMALRREVEIRKKLQWSVEELQDLVEYVLGKLGYQDVLHQFVVYRERKAEERKEKMALLKRDWLTKLEKRLSVNVIRLLTVRYLWKTEEGDGFKETVDQMFERVAIFGALPEVIYDMVPMFGRVKETTYLEKWRRVGFDEVKNYLPEDWEWYRGVEKDTTDWERMKQRLLDEGIIADKEEDTFRFVNPVMGREQRMSIYHLERLYAMAGRFEYAHTKMGQDEKFMTWLNAILNGQAKGFYEWVDKFYRMMTEQIAMPNTPALINGGRPLGMSFACFVVPTGDSVNNIFQTAYDIALITKMGGGIGVDISAFRPNGDIVRGTNGVSSGALSWLELYNKTLDVLQQGSTRRGAGMGVMWHHHPEIVRFLGYKKDNDGESILKNFNISMGVDEKFWNALWSDGYVEHVNPRNGKVVGKSKAKDLLMYASQIAWKSGDPAILNFYAHNKYFPLKSMGLLHSTNPCGEEALLPYQSCNLISINIHKFVHNHDFDWVEYRRWIEVATRWADNMNDVSNMALPENEYMIRRFRNVGVGLMGVANTLFELEIPYNSEAGFKMMEKWAETLSKTVIEYSVQLAKEKYPSEASVFYRDQKQVNLFGVKDTDQWNIEIMEQIRKYGIRNIDHTTMPPTGSVSMIAETSSGIEPQFALAFVKKVTVGTFRYVNKVFEKYVRTVAGDKAEQVLDLVAEAGNITKVKDKLYQILPKATVDRMAKIFVTAMEIHWYDHVMAQYHIQKWVTNSISKTINMPSYVQPEDVFKVYILAGLFDLKGVTVYRNGSLMTQVLNAGDDGLVQPPSEYTKQLIADKVKQMGVKWLEELFGDVV